MVAVNPRGSLAPGASESARPGRAGSSPGLRARVGGARQGLLEPGPAWRWDHLPDRRGLFPARAGARVVADGLQAPRDRADVDTLRGTGALVPPLKPRPGGPGQGHGGSARDRTLPGVADLAPVRERDVDSAPAGQGLGGSRCAAARPRAKSAWGAVPPRRAERHARHRGDGAGRTLLPPRQAGRGLAEPDRDLPGRLPRMSPRVGAAGRHAPAGILRSVRFVRLPTWAKFGLNPCGAP